MDAKRSVAATLLGTIGVVIACSGGGSTTTTMVPASQIIKASTGGTVAVAGGPSVNIPAGALSTDTVVTIQQSSTETPSGAITPVYEFGPAGIAFSQPVTVVIPVPAGTPEAAVWTQQEGTANFAILPTTISGGNATVQVTHFSRFVVGPVDISGAWQGQVSYTVSNASGALTGTGTVGQVRDVSQSVGQVTITARASNGTTTTCNGTYAGGKVSANCTHTSADGKCTAPYTTQGTASSTTWNMSSYSYQWSGTCGSAGLYINSTPGVFARPPGASENQIVNGDFASGSTNWTTYADVGGALSIAADAGELRVSISSLSSGSGSAGTSPVTALQVSHAGPLDLLAGKSYRLTFDARAAAARQLTVSVWENGLDTNHDGSSWSTYSGVTSGLPTFNLTTSKQTFTVDFTMPANISNRVAGVCFFVGASATTLYLDNVVLTAL